MIERTPCSGFRAQFPELVYGEIGPEPRGELERHVEACLACREELDELRATVAELDLWKLEPAAGDARAIAAAARAGATLGRCRRRVPARALWIAAAAGLVFLCALGSDVRIGNGELVLRLGLPGAPPRAVGEPIAAVPAAFDEARVVAIAREEVARHSAEEALVLDDLSAAQVRERARLIEALDRARASDRRLLVELVDSLASRNVQENARTRDALVELAALVTEPIVNPR
jgi:anti-sigma factor RsiW